MNLQSEANPVAVICSAAWASTCVHEMVRLGITNPLVVSSRGTAKRTGLAGIFSETAIFDEVLPNPTIQSCQQVIDASKLSEYDGVIAIGGGSVMDTAKCALAALGAGSDKLAELLAWDEPFSRQVPSIFIPTTHGTASEVTMWGTLWDLEAMAKLSISHPALYPSVAVLDGSLCLSLPMDISLTTALDALSHSFEAIWNRNATSPSTQFAVAAICQIVASAPLLKENPDSLEVRQKLLEAATMAGLAFSQTKTAAAHSISYPLTLHYNIPHGIAASMSLLPLLDINGGAIDRPIGQIMDNLELSSVADLKSLIRAIPEGYLQYRLRDWSLRREAIPVLVEQSFTKGRMENNIITLSPGDVGQILESIY
jgi:alcohol dehydrogenase class IV